MYLELLICWKPKVNEDNEQNFEHFDRNLKCVHVEIFINQYCKNYIYISKRFIYLCQFTQMGIYLFLEMCSHRCKYFRNLTHFFTKLLCINLSYYSRVLLWFVQMKRIYVLRLIVYLCCRLYIRVTAYSHCSRPTRFRKSCLTKRRRCLCKTLTGSINPYSDSIDTMGLVMNRLAYSYSSPILVPSIASIVTFGLSYSVWMSQ